MTEERSTDLTRSGWKHGKTQNLNDWGHHVCVRQDSSESNKFKDLVENVRENAHPYGRLVEVLHLHGQNISFGGA